MLEKTIEQAVVNYAKKLGFLTFKFSSPSNRGVPDRIFIKKGKIFFIEFKKPNGKLRKLQEHVISSFLAEKVDVYVIDDIEKGKKIIENISKNT